MRFYHVLIYDDLGHALRGNQKLQIELGGQKLTIEYTHLSTMSKQGVRKSQSDNRRGEWYLLSTVWSLT